MHRCRGPIGLRGGRNYLPKTNPINHEKTFYTNHHDGSGHISVAAIR